MSDRESTTVQQLKEVRYVAWAALVPALDHAISMAKECEFLAAQAAVTAQCSVQPVYPPIVALLAQAGNAVKE